MNIEKDQSTHRVYLESLRRMTPEQRLLKACDLSDFTVELFKHGLRQRFPDLSEDDFNKLLSERLALCHNRNW